MLKNEIKSSALREGAVRVGIADRETFADAPPSADMRYLMPRANSVVSFAVSVGSDWARDYLGKKTRMVFKKKLYNVFHEIYRIGAVIEARLKAAGFHAHNIVPNCIYRPDHTFEKDMPDTDVKPPLSLRYMAVGAGVGRFGWSGNVLVPGVWSTAYLGGVLTDARLEPDPPLEKDLCENCRICTRVCPVGFIDPREKVLVNIGGRTYHYNKKRSDLRCVIGCFGYTGMSVTGRWSSWSTGRTVLPEDDALLPGLLARLRDDPSNVMARRNMTFGSRGVLDRSEENTNPTCNHCLAVCSGPLPHRKKLMQLLFDSGVVERDARGNEIVIRPEPTGREK